MMMMQGKILDESISDLTSTSGELSAYSAGGVTNLPPSKRKRSLPGNPDPEAEVIAMSPKSLLATNRFLCEICNKGFQRDQNLQLHRRGHNLPWKLKQRSKTDVIRKKVYVCPEVTCVHHDPSRALGDLTGIKKHFFRKHGEKKWKCEKCSKKYAVQSDWKVHSKICGTREYRCDCGTLFSRRDSFITHRAFCDVLAEENARSIINPLLSSHNHQQQLASHFVNLPASSLKREQESLHLFSPPTQNHNNLSSQMFPVSSLDHQSFSQQNPRSNPNPAMTLLASPLPAPTPSAAHMSATALLQKAAQMGVTMSNPHMPGGVNYSCGVFMSSRAEIGTSDWNKAAMEQFSVPGGGASHLVHSMMSSFSSGDGFAASSSFEDDFNGGTLSRNSNPNPKSDRSFQGHLNNSKSTQSFSQSQSHGINDGVMTRDFLGLKGFPGNIPPPPPAAAGTGGHLIHASSTYGQRNQNQLPPWQG